MAKTNTSTSKPNGLETREQELQAEYQANIQKLQALVAQAEELKAAININIGALREIERQKQQQAARPA